MVLSITQSELAVRILNLTLQQEHEEREMFTKEEIFSSFSAVSHIWFPVFKVQSGLNINIESVPDKCMTACSLLICLCGLWIYWPGNLTFKVDIFVLELSADKMAASNKREK